MAVSAECRTLCPVRSALRAGGSNGFLGDFPPALLSDYRCEGAKRFIHRLAVREHVKDLGVDDDHIGTFFFIMVGICHVPHATLLSIP